MIQKWLHALLLVFLVPSLTAHAATVEVEVLDRDGKPVPGVVVYAPGTEYRRTPLETRKAVMDQVDTEFVPHVLVVQEGTQVEFPNSDVIAHHVYSFSEPNDFMLPLYKGDAHVPIRFEHAGLVTLGCNIHDQMLAYILVVDTDVFAKTDIQGKAVLEVNAGTEVTINIWSPRIRSSGEALALSVDPGQESSLTFRLSNKLRPAHGSESGGVQWTDY